MPNSVLDYSGSYVLMQSMAPFVYQRREHAKTKLFMPVITIGGTASLGANLEPEIRPLVENLRSVMIDDCGHYLAEERPERVIEELLRFSQNKVKTNTTETTL